MGAGGLAALREVLRALGVASWMVEDILDRAGPAEVEPEDERPVYVISAAAELAGMHPQTLRQYDRLGLVTPRRTKGRGRRYSLADVRRLREVQRLSHEEGINLAGISRIMELERANERLGREVDALRSALEHLAALRTRVFAADPRGGVTEYARGQRPRPGPSSVRYSSTSQALVIWRGASGSTQVTLASPSSSSPRGDNSNE